MKDESRSKATDIFMVES